MMNSASNILNIALAGSILLFIMLVFMTREFKVRNPVLASTIGSSVVALTVLKMQELGYFPVFG